MKLRLGWTVLLITSAAACTQPTRAPVSFGADQDDHGCRASAGYAWCTRTQQCERPWELAQRERIENTKAAFDAFCASAARGP